MTSRVLVVCIVHTINVSEREAVVQADTSSRSWQQSERQSLYSDAVKVTSRKDGIDVIAREFTGLFGFKAEIGRPSES